MFGHKNKLNLKLVRKIARNNSKKVIILYIVGPLGPWLNKVIKGRELLTFQPGDYC